MNISGKSLPPPPSPHTTRSSTPDNLHPSSHVSTKTTVIKTVADCAEFINNLTRDLHTNEKRDSYFEQKDPISVCPKNIWFDGMKSALSNNLKPVFSSYYPPMDTESARQLGLSYFSLMKKIDWTPEQRYDLRLALDDATGHPEEGVFNTLLFGKTDFYASYIELVRSLQEGEYKPAERKPGQESSAISNT